MTWASVGPGDLVLGLYTINTVGCGCGFNRTSSHGSGLVGPVTAPLGPVRPVAPSVVPVGSVVINLVLMTPVVPVRRTGSDEYVRSCSGPVVCFQAALAVQGSNLRGQRPNFIQRVCVAPWEVHFEPVYTDLNQFDFIIVALFSSQTCSVKSCHNWLNPV